MTGRRWPGRGRRAACGVRPRTTRDVRARRERGSFTAELAAGLPALLLLLLAGFSAVGAVSTKAQCVAAAREGAIAAARGEPGDAAAARVAPPGAEVTVSAGSESVTVRVRAPVRMLGGAVGALMVEERATAAREPSAVGGMP